MTRRHGWATRRAGHPHVAIPSLTIIAALLVPASAPSAVSESAQAAAETCRGQQATLVGGPVRLLGTPGPDVIVTNGSGFLNAGAGDDLVCVTGQAGTDGQLSVYAGPGNDIIDSAGAPDWRVYAVLGSGADVLVSGFADDQVWGGTNNGEGDMFGATDSEADTIATGDGRDAIISGDFTDHNADVIDAGPGDDEIGWLGARLGTGGLASGGDGRDALAIFTLAEQMTLDNNLGVASANGVAHAAWNKIENFRIDELYGPDRLTYVGGPGNELLTLPTLFAQVSMGPGNDTVDIGGDFVTASTFNGGEGADRIHAVPTQNYLWLDMASGRLDIGRNRGADREATVGEFENFNAYASRFIWLRGTSGRDALRPQSCRVDVAGRGGPDRIRPWPNVSCGDDPASAILSGGAGADEITGTRGDDVIRGGPGRDVVDGLAGTDVCRTEVHTRCEN